MNPNLRVRRSDQAVFRELAGEGSAVLLNLETGAYHSLNAVGTLIWNLIGEGSTMADLVAGVREEIPDVPPGVDADIESFVQDLVQRDLLIRSG